MQRQRLIESYLSREERYWPTNWCDDHHIPKNTMEKWLKNSFYNLRLRQEVVNIAAELLGEGYGRVVPGNPDEEILSDADTLLTFCTHNLNIQVNDDKQQRLTVINLP